MWRMVFNMCIIQTYIGNPCMCHINVRELVCCFLIRTEQKKTEQPKHNYKSLSLFLFLFCLFYLSCCKVCLIYLMSIHFHSQCASNNFELFFLSTFMYAANKEIWKIEVVLENILFLQIFFSYCCRCSTVNTMNI